ncbi:MAG: UDP-N-acetylmuramoyl-L-alanine--D-glutamate ligase [Candidatus Melainabacteria bacterium HGW-Melainabacteria-1]|nr:MAG: UDP-N-acetylmuramoyl-L-alanine--D-glutamate ligase [Candidatus Melainabacteria bacterium HGW-Melainabacteria-1]
MSEPVRAELEAAGIQHESGGHSEAFLTSSRFAIASPGIPVTAKPFAILTSHGIPVLSEIELASHFCSCPVLAVTGSNGKSTTVTLLTELLKAGGLRTAAGGNIGTPFISLLDQNLDAIVLELSSFQLETTYTLKPRVAVLLNLFENHLDRHASLEAYFHLKARIFQAQDSNDHAVLNAGSPWCRRLAPDIKAKLQWFNGSEAQAVRVEQGLILYHNQPLLAVADLGLRGAHNLENVLAALTAVAAFGLPSSGFAEVLRRFGGIPHRLETLASLQDRLFINDSKATNYLAAETALRSLNAPIILIAGGQDKGGDFAPLAQAIQEQVKHTVLLGSSAADFTHRLSLSGYNQCTVVKDMQAAVEQAYRLSSPGDIILLSPATASYDLYRNFEERGDDFRRHVAALISQTEQR